MEMRIAESSEAFFFSIGIPKSEILQVDEDKNGNIRTKR